MKEESRIWPGSMRTAAIRRIQQRRRLPMSGDSMTCMEMLANGVLMCGRIIRTVRSTMIQRFKVREAEFFVEEAFGTVRGSAVPRIGFGTARTLDTDISGSVSAPFRPECDFSLLLAGRQADETTGRQARAENGFALYWRMKCEASRSFGGQRTISCRPVIPSSRRHGVEHLRES